MPSDPRDNAIPVLRRHMEDSSVSLTVVEIQTSDLPRGATAQDLVNAFERRVKCTSEATRVLGIEGLQLYGDPVSADCDLSPLVIEVTVCCPRFLVRTIGDDKITVFIKTLTGKTLTVKCHRNDEVIDVCNLIEKDEGIPVDQQRLIYKEKQLETIQTLRHYGIEDEATCHLVYRFRGGGELRWFADVSSSKAIFRYDLSNDAPPWRQCEPGLNLEGRCPNEACAAHGHMVIHSMQFARFNLFRDSQKIACPLCGSIIQPVTCGLFSCLWKYEGIRASDMALISSKWKQALGEQYHRFNVDEHNNNVIEWASLLIVVKEPRDTQRALTTRRQAAEVIETDICATSQSSNHSMTTGVGTSRWLMSEAILGGGRYDEACDVYPLGVVLTELDTHVVPFHDVRGPEGALLADVAILQRVAHERLQPPVSASCPSELASLARACMAFDTSERPLAQDS
ncbi:hypothetical protein P43SY_004299 [Pythium insidiosum]|uniref:Ubiquitin-like domain-containing protein n=1 Tax=Pythium insidiosum TaxID=114742 RepID=A0AAD5LKH9_PYTIN|nr:hypothetical protein P43SY_004299 [Pythium insidiosum]